jgi:hypothetical protein
MAAQYTSSVLSHVADEEHFDPTPTKGLLVIYLCGVTLSPS